MSLGFLILFDPLVAQKISQPNFYCRHLIGCDSEIVDSEFLKLLDPINCIFFGLVNVFAPFINRFDRLVEEANFILKFFDDVFELCLVIGNVVLDSKQVFEV